MTFVKTIQKILAIEPDKIKQYNNVYYSSDGIKGDAAYIINKDTFLKYFNGYNIILIPAYRWKYNTPQILDHLYSPIKRI